MSVKTAPPKFNEILCIGLGVSGVCLGVQLKRRLGITDVHFYDRNTSHSGTWFANHYPGAACDVPALFYSYSFEPNPNWTRLLPAYDEIQKYIEGVVDKYQLRSYMTFRTECESAKWDDNRKLWTVYLRNLATGEQFVHECRILFSAVGVLVDPRDPKIPGTETFEGPIFHTSRWRDDVSLEGKDVIVVGNGCSATQMVPRIVAKTKTLTQFINTPHWLLELANPEFGPGIRWAFRNVPLFGRFARMAVFLWAETTFSMFYMTKNGAKVRRATEKAATKYTLGLAPEKFHDILIPKFEIACKRRIFDPDGVYLNALHSPNLHLTKDPIVEVVPRGVRTATKTYPADVIVLATGFQTNDALGALRIHGRNGELLDDHWRKMGGPSAYNSTAVHGFPNFLMLYGPNSTTGHSSVILATENMINYAFKILRPVLKGEAETVEIKADAEAEYTRKVQEASNQRIFATCHNWYVNDGWNSVLYPWTQIYFWWRSTFPKWSHWDYKYTARRRRSLGLRTTLLTLLFTLSVVGAMASLNGVQWWPRLTSFASQVLQEGRKRLNV